MFKKTWKNIKKQVSPNVSVDELQDFVNDIEATQKEIANKKAKIKQEHLDGARITNHRFTL